MLRYIGKVFFLFIFVCAFLWAMPVEAAGWVLSTSQTTYSLEGIDFYESGASSFGVIVGQGGKIYVSTDGGATWLPKTSGTTSALYDVEVINSTWAWAVGANGIVLRTVDGGNNWVAQSSGTTKNLYAVYFPTGSAIGYAVGADGVVLYTSNGGSNWTVKTSGSAFDLFTTTQNSDPNSSTKILTAGNGGVVLTSTNSGDSWAAQVSGVAAKLSSSASYWKSVFLGLTIDPILLVGDAGVIIRSTNQGTNWSQIDSGTTANLTSVASVVSGDMGFAVGANGTILKTPDQGVTWTQESSVTTVQLNDVAILTASPFRVYTVGASGKLLRYDETPPGAPGNLTKTTADSDSTPTFTWSAASDQITPLASGPVSKYEYSLDGGTYTNIGLNLTLFVVDALSNGSHTLAVRAVDAAGNVSDPATLTFTINVPDTTAPTVSAVTPATATVSVSQTYSVAYSDNVGVTSCELFFDGDTTFVYMTIGDATSGTATRYFSFSTTGSHTLQAKCYDAAGKEGVGPLTTITVASGADITAPTGSISINAGATATNSTNVTLSLSCTDNVSCPLMQVATDGTADTESWGIYQVNPAAVTLASGDGTKTVAVRFKDGAGNISAQYTDTIILDTTAPDFYIVGSAEPKLAKSTSVKFTIVCSDAVSCAEIRVSTDGVFDAETWGPWNKTYADKWVTIPSGDGTKTVYMQIRDTFNYTSATQSALVTLDTTPPSPPSSITKTTVDTDTTPTFSWSAGTDINGTGSQTFKIDKSDGSSYMGNTIIGNMTEWTLTDPLLVGSYIFKIKVYDAAGNESEFASYSFTIAAPAGPDTTAPTGSVTINSGAAYTNSNSVTLTLGCSDNLGCSSMQIGVDGTVDTELVEGVANTKIVTLSSGDGVKNIAVKFKDAAGNISAQYSGTIILDTAAPTVSVITPTAAQATLSQSFTASYSDSVGVVSCDLYVDSSDQGPMGLSGTKAGTASRTFTFTDTASRTLQARCSDAAGNVGLGTLTTVSVSAAPANQVDTTAPSAPSGVKKVSDDTDKTPTFTWNSATDNSGVTSYVIQVDNGSLVDVGGALTYTAGSLSDGSHTIKVYAKDAAGNSSPVATFNFNVSATVETPTSDSTPASTPVSCSLTINGAYKLTGSPAVYYITDECTKRPFSKSNVFFTYFNSWSDVKVTTKTKLDKIPLDTLGFMPWGPKYDPKYGALVKIVSDPKVYLLLGGEKYWITEEDIFEGLKYKWDWIEDIDKKLLDKYVTGSEIDYTDHHPNYTLVKYASSSKVYRLEPDPADSDKQVKRHIKNEKVFNALNFRWDRIVTIPKTEIYKDGEELGEEDV